MESTPAFFFYCFKIKSFSLCFVCILCFVSICFDLIFLNQTQFFSENYRLLWWCILDFSSHLFCLNPASFLQSVASSYSDLPLSNQQPMTKPSPHPTIFSLSVIRFTQICHNMEENTFCSSQFIATLRPIRQWIVQATQSIMKIYRFSFF